MARPSPTPNLPRPHTTAPGHHIRPWRVTLVATLLCLAGCAEEDAITTIVGDDDMGIVDAMDTGGSLDSGATVDALRDLTQVVDLGNQQDLASDLDSMEDMTRADSGSDMENVPGVSYVLCTLGQRAPWGDCLPDDLITFGRVPAAQRVERLARIDNDGEVAIIVTRAMFSQMEYQVAWRTYDRAQPPVSVEQMLPYTLEPGESLFAAVSLFGGLTMAQLPGTQLEIKIDAGGQSLETLTVELEATYEGCGIGLASCDMDTSNGCEVNITTDLAHCGGCNTPCALSNATARCAGSSCLIDTCAPGFDNCDALASTGCETDTNTSMQHCGGCDTPCAYSNATAQCDTGSCVFQGCTGAFADCDNNLANNGCESNTDSSLAHCGGCNQPCDYVNATETCSQGSCVFQGCEANAYDLNNDLADGCEYSCVIQGTTDLPDTQHIDANCDGIDGDVLLAVFVAKTGNDANAGTQSSPFRTISKALNVAATTSGISQILVASGNYEEQIFLVNGTHLAGGYETTAGWARSNSAITRSFWGQAMSSRIVAMSGSNITLSSSVSRMTVEAIGTSANSTSTYGLHCQGCTGLALADNIFIAGDAGDGASGINGAAGVTNNSGSGIGGPGQNGSCSSNPSNNGGSGGFSACSRHGGTGGAGGDEGNNRGANGSAGVSGTPGGIGGNGGSTGRAGTVGSTGASGNPGNNGSAGFGGSLLGGYWRASDGGDGGNGNHGNGGGGGGGGGGQGCFTCNNGAGNGGGGGGAGGCAGTQGTGGNAGGSSFAVFLLQSTGIAMTANAMRAGNAGDGGNGGSGGLGSAGLGGGTGATACTQDVGAGGNGGSGGSGGRGGHGGGGAGGNSYAIWRESTTVGLPAGNVLTFGQAGTGGTSMGNNGSVGAAGTYR